MRLSVTVDRTKLLDGPSELGVVLATLIGGDEIEVQDLDEPWVRVLTPLGATGWIRSTSLGVGGAAPDTAGAGESTEPSESTESPEPKRRGFRLPRRSRDTRPAT